MSRNVIFKIKNFLMLSILLPVVSGCGGGSDGGSLASLFGSSTSAGSGSGGIAGAGAGVAGGVGGAIGGGGVPALVNPEPATLLLIGSGIAAISYLKRHRK